MIRASLACLLLLLAGCGEDTGATSAPEETVMTPADSRVQDAVADLAQREGVDEADVVVVEARDVTWSDGSLGCPKPGMSYTQALVQGYLAVLEVDGRRFEYHGGGQGALRFCDSPKPPVG